MQMGEKLLVLEVHQKTKAMMASTSVNVEVKSHLDQVEKKIIQLRDLSLNQYL